MALPENTKFGNQDIFMNSVGADLLEGGIKSATKFYSPARMSGQSWWEDKACRELYSSNWSEKQNTWYPVGNIW